MNMPHSKYKTFSFFKIIIKYYYNVHLDAPHSLTHIQLHVYICINRICVHCIVFILILLEIKKKLEIKRESTVCIDYEYASLINILLFVFENLKTNLSFILASTIYRNFKCFQKKKKVKFI